MIHDRNINIKLDRQLHPDVEESQQLRIKILLGYYDYNGAMVRCIASSIRAFYGN